jgi:hypothetical protein
MGLGRRDVLGLATGLLAWAAVRPAQAQGNLDEAPFEPKSLPFPVIAVRGADAVKTWERLRDAGKGWPVILGDDLAASYLPESLKHDSRSVADILKAAATLTFPASVSQMRDKEREAELARLRSHPPNDVAFRRSEETLGEMNVVVMSSADSDHGRPVTYGELLEQAQAPVEGPALGEWPTAPEVQRGPISLIDYRTEKPVESVLIGLLPTTDPAEIPAHLRFGDWNACPPAEQHVAVLRALRERYGAEVAVCTNDTLELRVQRRPKSPAEAIALARDLHPYCSDSIDQGYETVSARAAALMASDWWTFWWD